MVTRERVATLSRCLMFHEDLEAHHMRYFLLVLPTSSPIRIAHSLTLYCFLSLL